MNMMSAIYRINSRSARMAMRMGLQRWQLRGSAVECIVCGYRAKRFADGNWHVQTTCPKCWTETRHRLMIGALKVLPDWSFERLIAGKRVLHFAAERVIRDFFREHAAQYVSADLTHRDADLRVDITNMPGVADGSFDCCIACDVLEHVSDDRAALREMHRVLAPGGVAIITTPQLDHAATTYENPAIVTPSARKAAFGQHDHLRIYGDDLIDRMHYAGFAVSIVDAGAFDDAVIERYVLRPPVLSMHPLATNYRKVFFCKKGASRVA